MITVEGLTKIYGNRTALDHVSFGFLRWEGAPTALPSAVP